MEQTRLTAYLCACLLLQPLNLSFVDPSAPLQPDYYLGTCNNIPDGAAVVVGTLYTLKRCTLKIHHVSLYAILYPYNSLPPPAETRIFLLLQHLQWPWRPLFLRIPPLRTIWKVCHSLHFHNTNNHDLLSLCQTLVSVADFKPSCRRNWRSPQCVAGD